MCPQRPLPAEKPLHWVGSSRKELTAFPSSVLAHMALALRLAQQGGKHESAKVLEGFGDAGVLEVITDDVAGTFRVVYTVRLIVQRLKVAANTARELRNAQAEDTRR